MESLTIEEIELCLIALSQWEYEFRVTGEKWDDVEELQEKLERMKSILIQVEKKASGGDENSKE